MEAILQSTELAPINSWRVQSEDTFSQLSEKIDGKVKQGLPQTLTRKWHSESADPAKALGLSDILDRNPVVDIHYLLF